MASGLIDIDWGAPWLAPWRAVGEPLATQVLAGASVADGLNQSAQAAGLACRFQSQTQAAGAAAYERGIHEQGLVPTRDNLHDFFNGLCWLHWPQAKQQLNRLHVGELARVGSAVAQPADPALGAPGGRSLRGPVRDALTVFDENAALLQAPDPLWQALQQRRWADLFGPLRPLWGEARFLLFGHALLEQLVRPYKAITAHVWRVPGECDFHAPALDAWLAADLTPAKLATKPFAPLPVLGVPGWCTANEGPGFYQDSWVFRPARKHTPEVGHDPMHSTGASHARALAH